MTVIYINGRRTEVSDKGADEIMRLRSLLERRNNTIREMTRKFRNMTY